MGVNVVGRDAQHIAGRTGLDHIRSDGAAQLEHRYLQRVVGLPRGLLTPQLIDQQLDRPDLLGIERQETQHRSLAPSRDSDQVSSSVDDLEWTEKPDLHGRNLAIDGPVDSKAPPTGQGIAR